MVGARAVAGTDTSNAISSWGYIVILDGMTGDIDVWDQDIAAPRPAC